MDARQTPASQRCPRQSCRLPALADQQLQLLPQRLRNRAESLVHARERRILSANVARIYRILRPILSHHRWPPVGCRPYCLNRANAASNSGAALGSTMYLEYGNVLVLTSLLVNVLRENGSNFFSMRVA